MRNFHSGLVNKLSYRASIVFHCWNSFASRLVHNLNYFALPSDHSLFLILMNFAFGLAENLSYLENCVRNVEILSNSSSLHGLHTEVVLFSSLFIVTKKTHSKTHDVTLAGINDNILKLLSVAIALFNMYPAFSN